MFLPVIEKQKRIEEAKMRSIENVFADLLAKHGEPDALLKGLRLKKIYAKLILQKKNQSDSSQFVCNGKWPSRA
jgi:hypothetical protein